MHNQNTQTLPKIKFTPRFSSLIFLKKFLFCLPLTPKPFPSHLNLTLSSMLKTIIKREIDNRITQLETTKKSFPYKPNNPTPKVPSQPLPPTKAKNQVKNYTLKHKHSKKKEKKNKTRKLS